MKSLNDEISNARDVLAAAKQRFGRARSEIEHAATVFHRHMADPDFQQWLCALYESNRSATADKCACGAAVDAPSAVSAEPVAASGTTDDAGRVRSVALASAASAVLTIAFNEGGDRLEFGRKLADAIMALSGKASAGAANAEIVRDVSKAHYMAEAIADVAMVAEKRGWEEQIKQGRLQDLPFAIRKLVNEFRDTREKTL